MEEATSSTTSIKNEPVSDKEEESYTEHLSVLLEVKEEPGTEVHVKTEPIDKEEQPSQETLEEQVCTTALKAEIGVKEEPPFDGPEWEPSDDKAQTTLYAGHEIKQDLVISVEALQPADAVFATDSSFGGKTCIQEAGSGVESDQSLLIIAGASRKTIETGKKKKTEPKTYTCDLCKRSYSVKKLLIRHIYYHGYKKPYYCKICDKLFTSQTYGLVHKRKHTGVRPFHCHICPKQFISAASLLKHTRTHSKSKPYKCGICQKSFREKSQLTVHSLIHQGDSAKRYTCEFCKKKFVHKYKLANHMRLHTGDKPFECDVCNEKFSFKYYLLAHLRGHAQETASKHEQTYTCKKCLNIYLTVDELATHERKYSNGSCVKLFTCETCGKIFKANTELKRHERIHTGEKPYPCEICGRAFTQQSHLKSHRRIHTGQKAFTCDVCNRRFTEKRYLNKHQQKTHTGGGNPNACRYCGKEFPRPCNLAIHEKAHVKPGKYSRGKIARVDISSNS